MEPLVSRQVKQDTKFTCNITFSRIRIPASLFVHLVLNVPFLIILSTQFRREVMISYFTLVTFHTHTYLYTLPALTETKSLCAHSWPTLYSYIYRP
jgi:hypothetical protein